MVIHMVHHLLSNWLKMAMMSGLVIIEEQDMETSTINGVMTRKSSGISLGMSKVYMIFQPFRCILVIGQERSHLS